MQYFGKVLIGSFSCGLGLALLMTGLWKVQREPFWLEMAIFSSKRELSELRCWYGRT